MKQRNMIYAGLGMALLLTACGHTHTWAPATCTEPSTCTECGAVEGEALGHSVSEWTMDLEPTCSQTGRRSGFCSRCGEIVTEVMATTAHTPGQWAITQMPSIDGAGEESLLCAVCGEIMETRALLLTPEEREELYIEQCVVYGYDQIARDPELYMDTLGTYFGEVIQVMEHGNQCELRMDISYNGYFYEDTIYVVYERKEGESRILEGDMIAVYGVNKGLYTYESIMGAEVTLPLVYAEYIR